LNMLNESFTFKAKIWEWTGKGAWHFVSVPQDVSTDISNLFAHAKRGWGSLPVLVTLGSSSWNTSIFPDKKTGTYLLPIKSNIRKQAQIKAGDVVEITLEIKG
jgi:hypothetical protein